MTHAPVSAASSSSTDLPLAPDELTRYFDQHRVPDNGRQLIQQVLHGDPVRRVGGGGRAVVVRYASRKMNRVIQAESRNVELVFLERCEHDPNVVFFLCQPARLSVRITDAKGRERNIRTVPDYLVLHEEDGFYFVECKPLSVLEKWAVSSGGRFVREGSGWSWPAAEAAAAPFGLGYRVFTPEASRLLLGSQRPLRQRLRRCCLPRSGAGAGGCRIGSRPCGSIRVHELLADTDADPETVWWLLANGRIAADLQRELCFDLDTSWVHASYELMIAARHRPRSTTSRTRVGPTCAALRAESGPWPVVGRQALDRGQRCRRLHHAARRLREWPLSCPSPSQDFERLFAQGHLRATEESAAGEIASAVSSSR